MVHSTCIIFVLFLFVGHAACEDYVAQAIMVSDPGKNTSKYLGTITFTQKRGEKNVLVQGQLTAPTSMEFKNTMVGFHVHATGNFTDGCLSAGPHYNPTNQTHGAPNETVRHVGDLGMVTVVSFTINVDINDSVIQLVGPQSIIGRSLVLHQAGDDMGKGSDAESKKTGNAGARVACGVIALASDFSPSAACSVSFTGAVHILVLLTMIFVSKTSIF